MERIYKSDCGKLRTISVISTLLISAAFFSAEATYLFDKPQFELNPRKVYGYPGEQHLAVPVLLTNSDSVGQWNILMEYDISAGTAVDVQLYDSVRAVDPVGDTLMWYYAPWAGNPEHMPQYFDYELNVEGHDNYVRIWGRIEEPVPCIQPGSDQLLFGFVFDVSPLWYGHNVIFAFHTHDCEDNTLIRPSVSPEWGPDTLSAPPSICPERPDSLRVIRLTHGPGIGFGETYCGDVNCDSFILTVADLLMWMWYYGYLYAECENIGCDTAWLECATQQSDMNGDDYPWTIADYVGWLHYMFYGGTLCDTIEPVFSDIDTMRVSDSSGSPGETVSVFINLHNTFPICGYAFRIVYDSTLLTAIETNTGGGWLVRSGGYSFEEPLPPGSTSIAELIFVVDSNATPGTVTYLAFEDDTVMAEFYNSLSDSIGTHVAPKLIPGAFTIVPTLVQEHRKPSHFSGISLIQSFPNPFRTQTSIRYQLRYPSFVILEIYNCQGNLVTTLVSSRHSEGTYSVSWDGKDTSGRPVSTGAYFYRLKTGLHTVTKKMVVLR